MRPDKKRIDTNPERVPLNDNPFAQLAAQREALPVAAPAPPAPAPPAAAKVPYAVEKTRKGGFDLAIEKRSGGKVVTVVRKITRCDEALLGALKKLCGAGGALREDGIEIQGDHRDRIERFLRDASL